MDMNALKEAIDHGFQDLKSGLAEQFGEVQKQFGEVQKQFGEVQTQFGEVQKQFGEVQKQFENVAKEFVDVRGEINGTKAVIEDLRHDLKIFDEDSTPGSVFPLAQRVTSLEGRVKKLEER